MLTALIAIQLIQHQPIMKAGPPLVKPNAVATARLSEPQRKMIEARQLLARAEAVRAGYAPQPGAPTQAELDATIDAMKSDLDAMSQMGEMDALRLQMAMDRMSKMMAVLSNLLEKISDTQGAIVQNIK